MSVPKLESTSPDEAMVLSDLETACGAPETTKEPVEKDDTMTTTAMYETNPVEKTVDKAPPPEEGKTPE